MLIRDVLKRLNEAWIEALDEPSLHLRLSQQFVSCYLSLSREPKLSERLRPKIFSDCKKLAWYDAEAIVDAFEKVADESNEQLCDELVDLRVTIALLGGVNSMMRLGVLAIEEIRARSVSQEHLLP